MTRVWKQKGVQQCRCTLAFANVSAFIPILADSPEHLLWHSELSTTFPECSSRPRDVLLPLYPCETTPLSSFGPLNSWETEICWRNSNRALEGGLQDLNISPLKRPRDLRLLSLETRELRGGLTYTYKYLQDGCQVAGASLFLGGAQQQETRDTS